jgi:hypothetical protein
MIYVSQIYDMLLALTRKDKRGLAFSPDDFNSIAPQVNQQIYRLTYSKFESTKLSIDEMDPFLISDTPITLDGTGLGALPINYFHLAGNPWYNHPTVGRRKIDLVTTLEFGDREMDYLTQSNALYPLCYMSYDSTSGDMGIHVSPSSCTPIYLSYLRQTVDPFLDYYVDETTLNVTYMAEGASVTIPTGCIARDGTLAGAVAISSTKNWEWHPHDIPSILSQLLQAMGISLPDELLVQVGAANEIKIEKD